MPQWRALNQNQITPFMERENTIETLKKVLQNHHSDYVAEMQQSDRLDKHFDSLDRVELAIDLERELNCSLPDSVIDSWQTIKDVIDTISKYMENKK